MKKYLFIILIIVFSANMYAQNIDLNYYSTGAGKNITATFSKDFDRSEFGIGLGCNIGRIKQTDDQDNIFYKRLFPTKPIHYLNFNAYYDYNFKSKWDCFKPLLFFDFQLKYSTTRTSMYDIYDYDPTIPGDSPEDYILYDNVVEYFGPFFWAENSIGLGFKVDITEKIFLKQRMGLGIHFIIGEDNRLPDPSPVLEFYEFVNIGLGIKLNAPESQL